MNQAEIEEKMRIRREKRRAEKEAAAKAAAAKERKRRDKQRQKAEEHLRQSKLKNQQETLLNQQNNNKNDSNNSGMNNNLLNTKTGQSISAALGAKGSATSINSQAANQKNVTIIAQQFQMFTSSQMQIGKGNFGVLYLGKKISNNELVAIKLESRHGRSHTSQLEHEWAHYKKMESTGDFPLPVEGLPTGINKWDRNRKKWQKNCSNESGKYTK